MDSWIGILLFFAFLGGWKLVDHLKKSNLNENMFKKIGWIAEQYNHNISERVKLRDMELLSYLIEEQVNLEIPEDLRIDCSHESEKTDAEKILNSHKTEVIKNYFSDFLNINKKICKLNSLEYYFYSLYCFVYKELKEYKYQDKIYRDTKYTDKTHFNCQLTDYGRTYYKLYLITNMYIIKNEKIRSLFEYIDPNLKDQIIDHLQTNEVSFYRYRP